MTAVLRSTLDALLSGSLRTRPSRLPRMLWPTQLRMCRLRAANIGASTVFNKRLAGLAVLAAVRDPSEPAPAHRNAGNELPSDGVKLT